MSHVRNRDIAAMSQEALGARLLELQEELLQLQAEKALGGTPSTWVHTRQHAEVLHASSPIFMGLTTE